MSRYHRLPKRESDLLRSIHGCGSSASQPGRAYRTILTGPTAIGFVANFRRVFPCGFFR
jgi:hypothetical protein